MQLTVVWHKPCWPSSDSASGYAARGCLGHPGHGGIPHQVGVLSELFDATRIVGPCVVTEDRTGELEVGGRNVTVVPLGWLPRSGWQTWPALPSWLARNGPTLAREIARADAVLAFVPSPIGVLGVVLALTLRKPLLVRQLNAWSDPRPSWRLERALLDRVAGGRNVVFATGDSAAPPSRRNPAIRWVFPTAISAADLADLPAPRHAELGPRARLASVGREVDLPGARTLFAALSILARDLPQVALDVIGDGPALSRCRGLAGEMQISERVTFHGSVSRDRLRDLLDGVDLLCLASEETEGSRQGLHEALACGLPVVAPPRGAPPGLLDGCGVIVDDPTPEAFADGVRACLSDPARYRSLSEAALHTARRHSVERWRETVRGALEDAWGPLAGRSVAWRTEPGHAGLAPEAGA